MARRIRPRRARNPERRSWVPTLSSDRVLIVCEGSVTEPKYFRRVLSERNLKSVQVVGSGKKYKSNPQSVVAFASGEKKKNRSKKSEAPPYDRVWCVLDSDVHENLDDAIRLAESNGIEVALSVPCFEFWLLLHFVFTTRSFADCGAVEKELRSHLIGRRYEVHHR